MMENQNQGNPNQGTDDFFEGLERQVNGGIMDDQPIESTPTKAKAPNKVTPNAKPAAQGNLVNWQKRYADSSREATKMREELNQLKPFVPLLDAMKQDDGLVSHVRGYFKDGGKPSKTIKEELGLGEDFVYDHDEALSDPDSKSAKVFNAQVDNVVNKRVGSLMHTEKAQAAKQQKSFQRQQEIAAFMKKRNMSEAQFKSMMDGAKTRKMSLDDVYHLLNKDKAAARVARNTRSDILQQAKNVRTMPATTANVNSPRADVSQDDQVFDELLGGSNDMDDLFS